MMIYLTSCALKPSSVYVTILNNHEICIRVIGTGQYLSNILNYIKDTFDLRGG